MKDLTYGEVQRIYSELYNRAPEKFEKGAEGKIRVVVEYLHERINAFYTKEEWERLKNNYFLHRDFVPAFNLFRMSVEDLLSKEGL